MKWVRGSVHGVLVAAIVFEILLFGLGIANRRQLQRTMIQPGAELAALVGYQADVAGGPYRTTADCVVYRLVSRRCVTCGREEPEWRHFMSAEAESPCRLVVLLPGLEPVPYYARATAMGAIVQIVWVPLNWARQVKLFLTPTTIVTRAGRIVWVREGAMDAQGFAELEATVSRQGGRG